MMQELDNNMQYNLLSEVLLAPLWSTETQQLPPSDDAESLHRHNFSFQEKRKRMFGPVLAAVRIGLARCGAGYVCLIALALVR